MKKSLCFLLIICLSLCLYGCSTTKQDNHNHHIGNEEIERLVVGENVDVKYSRTLPDKTNNQNSDKFQIALVEYQNNSGKRQYEILTIDGETNTASLFNYGSYIPLQIIKEDYIDHFSYSDYLNIVDIICSYTEQYGLQCFDKSEICELFIKRLTKDNKMISVDAARGAIELNMPEKSNELAIYSDVRIVFESHSAVPEYYIFKDTTTGNDFCWRIMDSNFNELCESSFKSYIEAKNFLTEDSEHDINMSTNSADLPNESSTHQQDHSDAPPTEVYPSNETPDVFYRVRKSADDSSSQIGAFIDYGNAKILADNNKYEGYKVYDNNGNLIYVP